VTDDPGAGGLPAAARSSRSFWLGLTAIALAGLAVRVGAAIWFDDRGIALWGDAVWYSGVARLIAEGDGFLQPAARLAFDENWPSAAHPPLYPLYLSLGSLVDDGLLAQRIWSAVPGAGTVFLLGILGRDLAGERTGLLAAALGAVYVDLFVQDVLLMSEGMFALTIVLTVLLAYRFVRRPDLVRAGLLAGAIALASLTRAEGALLFVILLVPLALRARDLRLGRRLACIAVGAGVALVLFAPWLTYNNIDRFDRPVFLSTGLGGLVGSSNCPSTYSGPGLGSWGFVCAEGVTVTVREDETLQDEKLLDAGIEYARNHAGRLPVVIPVRLLRTFGFWAPFSSTEGDLLLQTGNARTLARVAVLQYWLYLAIGIAGFVVLVRRRIPVLPFVAPVVTVAAITVIGYGTMRFRVGLEVLLPVLAAVALDALWRTRSSRQADAAPNGSSLPRTEVESSA
jgi:4-amino-4-deoxy-L-arabinose transferase-like glycosyltransferase